MADDDGSTDIHEDTCPVDLARIEAINTASAALGVEMNIYNLELAISVRAYAQCEIEAPDFETAKQIVAAAAREGDPVRFAMDHAGTFDMGEGGIDSEGDEIGYLEIPDEAKDDDAPYDPIEFDFRDEGQPYAWTAAAIVKDLANLTCTGDHAVLDDFIQRAKDALKKGDDSEHSTGDGEGGADTITADRGSDRLGGDHQDDAA